MHVGGAGMLEWGRRSARTLARPTSTSAACAQVMRFVWHVRYAFDVRGRVWKEGVGWLKQG